MYEEDDEEDYEEEEEQKLPVFRVTMKRIVETTVDVHAESEEDAIDMCQVGIGVSEDGCLDARSDMKGFVEDYDATKYEDDVVSCEDVTDEYD